MEENNSYRTLSGPTSFVSTPQNSSCTGGTITDISLSAADEDHRSFSYTLTVKELRSCNGFESISNEQAEEIIQELAQLCALCFQALMNE